MMTSGSLLLLQAVALTSVLGAELDPPGVPAGIHQKLVAASEYQVNLHPPEEGTQDVLDALDTTIALDEGKRKVEKDHYIAAKQQLQNVMRSQIQSVVAAAFAPLKQGTQDPEASLFLRLRGLPTFPDGTADGVVAMGNAFQANKGPRKDEQPLINKLKENAELALEKQVAQGLRSEQTAKAAYLLVHKNLVKQVYIGGCARVYSKTCPKGWSESSAGTCEPSDEYTGPCAPTALSGFTAADKEDFAWRCKVSWPCEDACKRDFSTCPSGWTEAGGGACAAPADYDGICSPKTNFGTFSDARKAEWAAMCSAAWPCA